MKKCENCKFFIQHYTLISTGAFSKVHCGHCTKALKNVENNFSCKNFSAINKKTKQLEKNKKITSTIDGKIY